MKNKKVIVVVLVAIALVAAILGIFMATYNPNYIYNKDGKIEDGKQQLIEHLKAIEDKEERKNQIDFSVEQNIITQTEANELY